MKIWLDVSPLSWIVWPLWGSVYVLPYPNTDVTTYVGVGPFRLCWQRG
jgi:hypothetical protein